MRKQKKKTPNLQTRRMGTPVEDEVKEIMAAATAEPEPKPTEEPTPTPDVEVKESAEQSAMVVPDKPTAVATIKDEARELFNLVKQGLTKSDLRVMYARWTQRKFNAVWEATERLLKMSVADVEEARAVAVARYNDLYKQAAAVGNIKVCKEVQDSLSKIQGLTRDVELQANFITCWKE